MKYKAGDKVIIVGERKEEMSPFGEMDEWLGDVMTIKSIDNEGEQFYSMEEDDGEWLWFEHFIDHEATAKLHGKTTTNRNRVTTHHDRAATIGALVDEKSAQYGDAIGAVDEVLRTYYPDGIAPDQYKNLGLIVRISDKLMRLANGHTEDTMEDIFGYLLLMMEDDQ